jgi:molybdopterin/thiamine biosynthesis adenylyltransferase
MTAKTPKRFERNIGAITALEQERLHNAKVFVAGCGGLGGYLIELLARAGVSHISCADYDVFDESNLNRQLLCNRETIGKKKAHCVVEYVKSIWVECDVVGHDIRLDESNLPELIKEADLIFDALDNVQSRLMLAKVCSDMGKVLVHGAVSGFYAQAALVRPNTRLYDKLYGENARMPDNSVLSFTASAAASLMASLGVRFLCGRDVGDGVFVLDLENMVMETCNVKTTN